MSLEITLCFFFIRKTSYNTLYYIIWVSGANSVVGSEHDLLGINSSSILFFGVRTGVASTVFRLQYISPYLTLCVKNVSSEKLYFKLEVMVLLKTY